MGTSSNHLADETRAPRLMLSRLLKSAALDAKGQELGRLVDVIVRLPATGGYPPVTGLVAGVGRRRVFIPTDAVRGWHAERIELSSARIDLRVFTRRDGEVLLRADVLGHRLLDTGNARWIHAHDLELTGTTDGGWLLSGVDVHRLSWLHRPGRRPGRSFRDWLGFEPLIGHQPSLAARRPLARLRRLKAAQLADLLEDASSTEQREILTEVHADPELEADVFEELNDDQQRELLAERGDRDIARVLAHMRADDAADAVEGLPSDRRRPVLDLLPDPQRAKVTTLLGYHTATAGGLMAVDFLALPEHTTAGAALDAARHATTAQPEALATVYAIGPSGRLTGAISLVALLQADPAATLHTIADSDPVRVPAHADLIDIATVMADYNLATLPVTDDRNHLLGVITVDDVLEVTIPTNWRNREPANYRHHNT